MIQRKQTIFLLLAMIATALTFFFPILGVESGLAGQEDLLFNLSATGSSLTGNVGLFIAMLLAFLVDGVAIFTYKQRKKQLKLILAGVVLMLLWYVLLAVTIDWSNVRLYHCHVSAVLPVVAVILNLMAFKGVKHDEELVRSMDRIR